MNLYRWGLSAQLNVNPAPLKNPSGPEPVVSMAEEDFHSWWVVRFHPAGGANLPRIKSRSAPQSRGWRQWNAHVAREWEQQGIDRVVGSSGGRGASTVAPTEA